MGIRAVWCATGVLAVVLCGGCADGEPLDPGLEPGEKGARLTVEAFLGGLAGGEPERVCSLLTVEAQRSLEVATAASSCLTGVERLGELDEEIEGSVGEVVLDGDAAADVATGLRGSVAEAFGAVEGTLHLTRADGRWMVTTPS
ncbi:MULTISPECIES: hypothetical protein [Cellulomonas]|uniref:Uncharacterized protein n=1 Tax=Cellulomonas uda TaxID=1714 RepID=A0A4Y3K9V0_CELUD|nr:MULTISPECIES: hypothetical protein [Cellulomonas]UJP39494.1 hypothetical protein F1D97_14360 [Cellulomonas palmilytica]GEA79755.1 hypothetical protein CUD01_01990 [Cellulomonas uda]